MKTILIGTVAGIICTALCALALLTFSPCEQTDGIYVDYSFYDPNMMKYNAVIEFVELDLSINEQN